MSSAVPLRLTIEEITRQLREAAGLPSDQPRTQDGGTSPAQPGTGEPVEKGQSGREGLQKAATLLSLGANATGGMTPTATPTPTPTSIPHTPVPGGPPPVATPVAPTPPTSLMGDIAAKGASYYEGITQPLATAGRVTAEFTGIDALETLGDVAQSAEDKDIPGLFALPKSLSEGTFLEKPIRVAEDIATTVTGQGGVGDRIAERESEREGPGDFNYQFSTPQQIAHWASQFGRIITGRGMGPGEEELESNVNAQRIQNALRRADLFDGIDKQVRANLIRASSLETPEQKKEYWENVRQNFDDQFGPEISDYAMNMALEYPGAAIGFDRALAADPLIGSAMAFMSDEDVLAAAGDPKSLHRRSLAALVSDPKVPALLEAANTFLDKNYPGEWRDAYNDGLTPHSLQRFMHVLPDHLREPMKTLIPKLALHPDVAAGFGFEISDALQKHELEKLREEGRQFRLRYREAGLDRRQGERERGLDTRLDTRGDQELDQIEKRGDQAVRLEAEKQTGRMDIEKYRVEGRLQVERFRAQQAHLRDQFQLNGRIQLREMIGADALKRLETGHANRMDMARLHHELGLLEGDYESARKEQIQIDAEIRGVQYDIEAEARKVRNFRSPDGVFHRGYTIGGQDLAIGEDGEPYRLPRGSVEIGNFRGTDLAPLLRTSGGVALRVRALENSLTATADVVTLQRMLDRVGTLENSQLGIKEHVGMFFGTWASALGATEIGSGIVKSVSGMSIQEANTLRTQIKAITPRAIAPLIGEEGARKSDYELKTTENIVAGSVPNSTKPALAGSIIALLGMTLARQDKEKIVSGIPVEYDLITVDGQSPDGRPLRSGQTALLNDLVSRGFPIVEATRQVNMHTYMREQLAELGFQPKIYNTPAELQKLLKEANLR